MSNNNKQRVKQSFIAGSLTSSAGIFLAKFIGLFYIVPFTALATENNMSFYSAAYTYYNVLLQICSAGLPFAVSAIVAKYANRDDYKTVVLVRRLSAAILSLSGFLMALIFAVVSTPLAKYVLGASATADDIIKMQTSFRILSLALFFVPILYSYRSFYQGLKEMKAYATTQVIEQIARVAALLGLGYVCVRIIRMNAIWAVYMAVLATSIGAIAGIIYYVRFDHRHYGQIARAARNQESEPLDKKTILMEIFAFGLPYLLSSILGNSLTIVNTTFFISTSTNLGLEYETAKLIYGIIEVQCEKLTSIPQVLGAGFSASIVPYMTVSLENRNMKELHKNIQDCLDTVLYIAVPICFAMFTLSRPIYFIMYGGRNLDYGEICLSAASFLALATTLTPICNSMMMTLRMRKECMFYLGVGFVIKCVTFYPLLKYTGYTGAITSSVLSALAIVYLDLAKLHNIYGVTYHSTAKRLLRMIIACLVMNAVFVVFKMVGFTITEANRMLALVELGIYGIVGMIVYFGMTTWMNVPQAIFHITPFGVIKKVIRRGR